MQTETRTRIALFDNHDEAYYLWKKLGLSDIAVVHIDAHHDLFTKTGLRVPAISDFLRWALREGMVREAFWVIPTPAFETPEALENVRAHLKILTEVENGPQYSFDPEKRIGSLTVEGRKLTVCSTESMPEISAPFVLDFDTDYMLLSEPPFSTWHPVPEKPWIWPDEVAVQLADLARRAEVVDICYSIAGGYTPPRWKHLGDDLAAIFADDFSEASLLKARAKRQMTEAFLDGNTELYASIREALEKDNPDDASLHYWHSLALLGKKDTAAAAKAHARAVELDSYYNCSSGYCGLIAEVNADLDGAEKLFREASQLNEKDPLGWYGLGRIALHRGKLAVAREFLTKAASLHNTPAEVYRELGALAESEKMLDEALSSYNSYMKAAFTGRSLEQPVSTMRDRSYRNPCWSEGYSALARVYTTLGNSERADRCTAQALRLMNPTLYSAVHLLLPGSRKKASNAQKAAAFGKTALLFLNLGMKGIGRLVKKRREPSVANTRLCAPIRIKKAI